MTISAIWTTLRTDQRGNVAVIFAAVLVPVIAVVATALDYGRASKIRDQLAHASEAAAQAASGSLELDRDRIVNLVQLQLDANLPVALKDLPFELSIPADKTSIEVTVATRVQTTLMGIVGIPELPVNASGFSRRQVPRLPADMDGVIAARPPQASKSLHDFWRAMFGGSGPDGDMLRAVEEAATQALARQREVLPSELSPPQAAPTSEHAIRDGEDLRRAARDIGNQIRDLPQFGGGQAPVDVERLMRELGRYR